MEKCLQCSKELKHVPGRKQKSFCNVNCRNKYFYAKRKQEIQMAKAALVSLPSDYANVKKVAILTEKGEVKPVFPKPNRKSKAKPPGIRGECIEFRAQPKDEAYDAPQMPKTTQDESPKIQSAKPKNLDELKALCPVEITDKYERAAWIGKERQKYGI